MEERNNAPLSKSEGIITSAVVLCPILIGIMLWNRLPDEMAVRFSSNNEVLSYSSKGFVIFGIPIMLFVCHFFCMLPMIIDPKDTKIPRKMVLLLIWTTSIISLPTCGALLLFSLGIPIDLTLIVEVVLGIVFLMLGNCLPKCRPTDTIVVKTLGALKSEDVRYRIQCIVGWSYVLLGICIFINCFLQKKVFFISVIVLSILIPFAYSAVAGLNYLKNN